MKKEFNELYNKYTDVSNYDEYINFFVEEFKKNKNNVEKLKIISPFEFIGYFATMVSQMELKIFNNLLEEKNISSIDEKINTWSRLPWKGEFRKEMTFDEHNFIIYIDKWKIDVQKFANEINVNTKILFNDLLESRWNKYITKIIKLSKKNNWFKEIRNYRHQLIHEVDTYKSPFSNITHNKFKRYKTNLEIKHLLKLAWYLKNFDLNKNLFFTWTHPNYYVSKFLINNATSIGFVYLYNKYSSLNKILINEFTNDGTAFVIFPQRTTTIQNIKKTLYIKNISVNDPFYPFSFLAKINLIDFDTLSKMGYEIIEK